MEYHLELGSAGVNDSNEVEFFFGPGSSYYDMTFHAGWNEIFLPLTSAHESVANVVNASYCDLNALRTIRVYTAGAANGAVSVWGDMYATVKTPAASEGSNMVILTTR